MTEDLAPLWRNLLGTTPPKNKQKSLLHAEKLKLLSALPSGITSGEQGASLARVELDRLLATIRSTLPARTFIYLTRFLSRGLAKGKREFNWSVAVPAVPLNLPRERARFTPQKFAGLTQLRTIEETFLASLEDNIQLTPKLHLGRMLLSAILYGGLLQAQWLEPWLRAAIDGARSDVYCLWLDLERYWQYPRKGSDGANGDRKRSDETPIIMTRRWFADPLSRILLLRWHSLPDDQRTLPDIDELPNAFDLVRMFLVKTGIPLSELPATANILLAMAETRLSLVVPPYLASYASGWLNGVSVSPRVWARLCSGKPVMRQSVSQEDEDLPFEPEHRILEIMSSNPAVLAVQQQLLRKLRRIFVVGPDAKKGNAQLRREIVAYMDKNGHELAPILHLLARWTEFLLARESKYSPATPRRYLGAVGNILLVVFGLEDLLDFEIEEFIERYDRAVEMVESTKEKGYARCTIGRFHQFLVANHTVPKLHQGYFSRRAGPAETTVDANLITQIEFDRLKDALGWGEEKRPRTASAAILVAVFGFRCGLRRNEVYKLRARDIQGYDRPELILRATSRRSLKSPCATRRLPIYLLFTQEEIKLLRGWLAQFDGIEPEALLFSISNEPHVLLPEAFVFTPIRQAMAIVTGDDTLRFQHFRHSFATWLLLRLTGSVTHIWEFAPFLDHPEFHEFRIEELRSVLLGNEQLGRSGAYAVASLCGHADLETTFTNYIHICDWLLGYQFCNCAAQPTLGVEAMIGATGLSRATLYRARYMHSIHGSSWSWDEIYRSFRKTYARLRDPNLNMTRELVQESVQFPAPALKETPLWKLAQRALTLHQIEKKSPDEISDLLENNVEAVSRWISTAAAIAEKKSARPSDRYLQHRDLGRVGLRTKKGSERLFWISRRKKTEITLFPVQPKGEDKKLAESMLKTFETLSQLERNAVFDQVDYFVEKFSLQTGMMCYWETGKARKYVDALQLLGVRNPMITLVDCMGNPMDDAAIRSRRSFWEKELCLKNASWRTNGKRLGRTSGDGTIGIQVTNMTGVMRASYGYRYALYMIAIAYRD